jgi:hypothetical protein
MVVSKMFYLISQLILLKILCDSSFIGIHTRESISNANRTTKVTLSGRDFGDCTVAECFYLYFSVKFALCILGATINYAISNHLGNNNTINLGPQGHMIKPFQITTNKQFVNLTGGLNARDLTYVFIDLSLSTTYIASFERGSIIFNRLIVSNGSALPQTIQAFAFLGSENASFIATNVTFVLFSISLVVSNYGRVNVTDCVFNDFSSSHSLFYFSTFSASSFIRNSSFTNISNSGSSAAIVHVENSAILSTVFTIENSNFSDFNTGSLEGGLFKMNFVSSSITVTINSNSFTSIRSSIFESKGGVLFVFGSLVDFVFRKNVFSDIQTDSNGSIYVCINNTRYTNQDISSNSFTNFKARYGGVFYFEWVFFFFFFPSSFNLKILGTLCNFVLLI